MRAYNIAALEFRNPNFDELKRRRATGKPAPKRRYGTVSRGVEV